MVIEIFLKTLLTGGTGAALDGIDGDDITDGDLCKVVQVGPPRSISYYRANATLGLAESSPEIIVPDTNPGSIGWELLDVITP